MNKTHIPESDQRSGINVDEVISTGKRFGRFLRDNRQDILDVLTTYETYHVAEDEMDRTLDLVENLSENSDYFVWRIKKAVSFLPINQPLYALACFGIIPALMAYETYVRPPQVVWGMMNRLIEVINLKDFFPNLVISNEERNAFIKKHTVSHTDVVIFTGNPDNAFLTQAKFGRDTLFIGNGSSHNPVIITCTADLELAIQGILEVQLYNQGGDCAAPNSILVEGVIYDSFIEKFHSGLKAVKVGKYRDKDTVVGPLIDKKKLEEALSVLTKFKDFIDPEAPGLVDYNTLIFEPAVILKPLITGGNYLETYAPIFFIQKYDTDSDLALYFEQAEYARNAGYITVYGHSNYVDGLIGHKFSNGRILVKDHSVVRNTHMHAPGIERGVNPYGGYGDHSSFISYKGAMISKPTLPQRDIFEHIVICKDYHLDEIKKDVSCAAEEIFGERLEYSFLSGSVAYGGGTVGKSDIDIGIVISDLVFTDKPEKWDTIERATSFAKRYTDIHKKHNFIPDTLFPGEILTESMVGDAIAGRGFSVDNSMLCLPKASNEYYMSDSEHWFRAWVSMLAFGVFVSGSENKFVKSKQLAWKTVVLFLLSQIRNERIDSDQIINILLDSTNKWAGFGITKNYFLFRRLETQVIETVLGALCEEGFVSHNGDGTYSLHYKRIIEWNKSVSLIIESGEIRRAPILIGMAEVKAISEAVTPLNEILTTSKYVVERSNHISIDMNKVKSFSCIIKAATMEHWLDKVPFALTDITPEEKLHFIFLLNALSFSYWGEPKWMVKCNGVEFDGAYGLMACFGRAISAGLPILDFQFCAQMSFEEFADILRGNIEIPLLRERWNILREVSEVMVSKYEGKVGRFLETSRGDAICLITSIIADFPSFIDSSQYKGETVVFSKRAQLMVADIDQMFRDSAYGNLKNADKLTACADYKLPQILRKVGILVYDKILQEKIDAKIEISAGSEEEVEIRANTIWAVELIKEEIRKHGGSITSNQINDYLWIQTQQKNPDDKPYHRTRTTAY